MSPTSKRTPPGWDSSPDQLPVTGETGPGEPTGGAAAGSDPTCAHLAPVHDTDTLGGHDPSEPFRQTGWRITSRRALRRCRELLGDHPMFLPVVLRLTPLGIDRKITDATDLVVEGFPRSGNTFASFAILEAQPRPIRLASHAHVPAQVKQAVRMGKPTLVVIREPVGCITSLLTAAPHVRFSSAINEYIHHHRQLLGERDGFVVATFERTTADLGSVIDDVNARFGTDFARFVHTPENTERVFAHIDAHYRQVYGERASERVVPRPSAARLAEKRWLVEQLTSPRYASQMAEAQEVYQRLAGGGRSAGGVGGSGSGASDGGTPRAPG